MKIALRVGLALVSLVLMAGTTKADVDVLTFQGLQNLEPIENFYNGGTGGFGSGPGPNYGISFSSDSLAIIASSSGGTGNFDNAPGGNTIAFFLNGAGDVMNVPAGFTTGFSFFYAAAYTGSVTVYSGLNGTGSVLATLSLTPTPDPYYVWGAIGVTFAGSAESAVFSGSANYIGFSDITLGSAVAGATVPEPSNLILAGVGGLGFFFFLRRRAKAQTS